MEEQTWGATLHERCVLSQMQKQNEAWSKIFSQCKKLRVRPSFPHPLPSQTAETNSLNTHPLANVIKLLSCDRPLPCHAVVTKWVWTNYNAAPQACRVPIEICHTSTVKVYTNMQKKTYNISICVPFVSWCQAKINKILDLWWQYTSK